MKIKFTHSYDYIISFENLLEAWKEFVRGKRKRHDVQEFQLNLMSNIMALHDDLLNRTYCHSSYEAFNISDPKPRNIHKAQVRDRLLHHALYRALYPLFEKVFASDSYSCQLGKGTHKAINRFRRFTYQVSENDTKTAWILKCDIKKFFENIDHKILLGILKEYIADQDIILLLESIVGSFYKVPGKGLPLGNLTSQLFVNIYMNEFDQFVKHKLKAKYYIRYADDFVIFSQDKNWLCESLPKLADFLEERLSLKLHPDKISIETLASGVDFLGWIHFPDHRVLRTTTKRKMFKTIKDDKDESTIQSYLGLLKHGNTQKLKPKINKVIQA